jgi:hypothetical protein
VEGFEGRGEEEGEGTELVELDKEGGLTEGLETRAGDDFEERLFLNV